MKPDIQILSIPPIVLRWEGPVTWDNLQQNDSIIHEEAGVYEMMYRDNEETARRLHIGKSGNNEGLRQRIHKMVHGRSHSVGGDILKYEIPTAGADTIVVRWAVTDRLAAGGRTPLPTQTTVWRTSQACRPYLIGAKERTCSNDGSPLLVLYENQGHVASI